MENVIKIVHIDDDPLELRRIKRLFDAGSLQFSISLELFSIARIADLFPLLQQQRIAIFLLDIQLSKEKENAGIALIQKIREQQPTSAIMMFSHQDDPVSVLESLQCGADDFVSKNTERFEFVLRILNSYEQLKLKRGEGALLLPSLQQEQAFAGETMQRIAGRVPQIINSAITSVFIQGESGTGKEVVADLFSTPGIPFVKLNCGSMAPSLLESELFGFARGAFTGALTETRGKIESASGGWLFLDEVETLSDKAQMALLRVLENQEIMRLGENFARKVTVRFLFASNQDIFSLVQQGKFRNDLWQRICETEVFLPPLRDRKGEIPALVQNFCSQMSNGPYFITPATLNILCQLPWREGNIRELRNCLRAMTENHVEKCLTPLSIPPRIFKKVDVKESVSAYHFSVEKNIDEQQALPTFTSLCDAVFLEYFHYLKKRYPSDNLIEISEKMGLARSTVYLKLKELQKK